MIELKEIKKCNCCGRAFAIRQEGYKEEVIEWSHEFGYFSKEKDGDIHSFSICEDCYEKWIGSFKIPVTVVSK